MSQPDLGTSTVTPVGFRSRRIGGFPVPAVEQIDLGRRCFEIEIVETADVDEVEFRRRSRVTEGMNPTVSAEIVRGDLGIKLIEF